ncbi:MAG: DUF4190 domain-containing protein [Actinomycetota bacterium]
MSNVTSYACPRCGAPLSELSTSCPMCGLLRPPFGQQRRPMPAVMEQHAIGAIVLAVIGLVLAPLALIAVYLAVRALRAIKQEPNLGGKRMAITALITSCISIGWWSFILIDQLRR